MAGQSGMLSQIMHVVVVVCFAAVVVVGIVVAVGIGGYQIHGLMHYLMRLKQPLIDERDKNVKERILKTF